MRAPKKKTDVRRLQLAQAALKRIAVHGLEGLRIADIAADVGLVPSAVYRHFGSKEDIVDSILEYVHSSLRNNLRRARAEQNNPLGQLEILMKLHVDMLSDNEALARIVFSQGIYGGKPHSSGKIKDILDGYLGEVQKMIRAGKRAGIVRQDVRPKTASLLFLGSILSAVIIRDVSVDGYDVMRHRKNIWALFCQAIAEVDVIP